MGEVLLLLGGLASVVTVVEVVWRPFGKWKRRRRDRADLAFLRALLEAGANSYAAQTDEEIELCERLVGSKYMTCRSGRYEVTGRGRAVAAVDVRASGADAGVLSMKQHIAKIEGRADHLLGGFLGLRMNFALLAPLLEDNAVTRRLAAGARREGFEALRYTLFSSCALDVVKLALDHGDTAPSIQNLMTALSDPAVVEALKTKYSRHPMPRKPGDEDKEELLKQIDEEHERELGDRFDAFLRETREEWVSFQSCSWCPGFKTLRDQHTAHLDLRLINEKYETLDIGSLGLKWGDVGDAVGRMAPLVWKLNVITRADFDMASAVEQFRESGEQFWA